jgi:glucosamine--fructose-6-phosphate aminotransferase (isomerizing)
MTDSSTRILETKRLLLRRFLPDDLVVIPKLVAQVSALLGVLPLQLLSYHMSVMRGFEPDFPRNLSKTLTVD